MGFNVYTKIGLWILKKKSSLGFALRNPSLEGIVSHRLAIAVEVKREFLWWWNGGRVGTNV
jgi:hypothetical protein